MESDLDTLMDEAVEEAVVELDTSDEAVDRDVVRYIELRNKKDELKAELSTIQEELDGIESRLIKVLWEARGIDKIRKDGNTISIVDDPWPKILDLDTCITWLDERGHGGIAKRTINAQTFRAWLKEQRENGADVPPETIVDPGQGKAIRLRRAR